MGGEEGVRYGGVQAEEVAVLLSGGVDSSVAMRLVQERGLRPRAFYLKIWLEDELAHLGQCPWEEDIRVAEEVCAQARVPLEKVPLQREYWDRVVNYTIAEARAGRTPNPDLLCNSRVKFGAFYERVGGDFARVVTGHYAQKRVADDGSAQLCMSPDPVKDQTYFLAQLTQAQLSRAEFPIGGYEKARVRELAREYALANMLRKDSQGICFLGKLKFDDFLAHHLGTRAGPLVEFETGAVVGEHRGFWFFTAGQRRGIRLPGGPWYVVEKDAGANAVFVSRRPREALTTCAEFAFEDASWIAGHWPLSLSEVGATAQLRVKTRHGPTCSPCTVTRTGMGGGDVKSSTLQLAFAPGQFAVFYAEDDTCLGCGVMSRGGRDVALEELVARLAQAKEPCG